MTSKKVSPTCLPSRNPVWQELTDEDDVELAGVESVILHSLNGRP